mmetsp:Transcript_3133/g.6627  ORF Transcript_3133/g.6627 Transcript_3133/m.6627 type:complete len:218 (+) Transcript_3133:199-852(+)
MWLPCVKDVMRGLHPHDAPHASRRAERVAYATVVPCQLEPIPAVHPKQWFPDATRSPVKSSNELSSKIEARPGACKGIASAWLKSQSYSVPSYATDTSDLHMRESMVDGLKLSTRSCMYSASLPCLYSRSAKRLMGMFVIVNSSLNRMPKWVRSSEAYFSRSAPWGGGRNAPAGLYTRSSFRSLPSMPYPAWLRMRSPSIERSKTLLPRCLFTFSAE